uniref:Uncharacterized protein n=1 Tax=Myotis myotis TaxID=51298 RepID=A0A7J7TID9_MYOMY|nr:hypothetical protein mMyoMyo1_009027 [Myotis myotis]
MSHTAHNHAEAVPAGDVVGSKSFVFITEPFEHTGKQGAGIRHCPVSIQEAAPVTWCANRRHGHECQRAENRPSMRCAPFPQRPPGSASPCRCALSRLERLHGRVPSHMLTWPSPVPSSPLLPFDTGSVSTGAAWASGVSRGLSARSPLATRSLGTPLGAFAKLATVPGSWFLEHPGASPQGVLAAWAWVPFAGSGERGSERPRNYPRAPGAECRAPVS